MRIFRTLTLFILLVLSGRAGWSQQPQPECNFTFPIITRFDASCHDNIDGRIAVTGITIPQAYIMTLERLGNGQDLAQGDVPGVWNPVSSVFSNTLGGSNQYTFTNLFGGYTPIEGAKYRLRFSIYNNATDNYDIQCIPDVLENDIRLFRPRVAVITVENEKCSDNGLSSGRIRVQRSQSDADIVSFNAFLLDSDGNIIQQAPNVQNEFIFSNLEGDPGAGRLYFVRVTYNNPNANPNGFACDELYQTFIKEPEAITDLFAGTSNGAKHPSCLGANDGSIDVNIVNGSGLYNAHWSNGINVLGVAGNDPQLDIHHLTAGFYKLTIIDANNCEASFEYELNNPKQLEVLPLEINNVPCFLNGDGEDVYGQIRIRVRGGLLSSPNAGTTPAPASVFSTKTVCFYNTATQTYFAGPFEFGTTSFNDTLSVFKASDFSLAFPPGNYSFVVFESSYAGGYNCSAPGNNYPFCHQTGTFSITQPNQLQIGHFQKDITCHTLTREKIYDQNSSSYIYVPKAMTSKDGVIDLTVTGGTPPYKYTWSDITDIPPGQQPQDRSNLDWPVSTFDPNYDPNNNLRPAVVSAQPDQWPFTVTVTDANGCMSVKTITLVRPTLFQLGDDFTPRYDAITPTCAQAANGAAEANVVGGSAPYASFVWDGGGQPVPGFPEARTNLVPGKNYYLTITDARGCVTRDSIRFENISPIELTSFNVVDVTCFAGADGVLTYSLNGGTPPYLVKLNNNNNAQVHENIGATFIDDFTALTPGQYTLQVIDQANCTFQRNFEVGQPTAISFVWTSTPVTCKGSNDGTASMQVAGGVPFSNAPFNTIAPYIYEWFYVNDPQQNDDTPIASVWQADINRTLVSGLQPFRKIYVKITDAAGCVRFTPPFEVSEPINPLSVLLQEQKAISCFDGNDGELNALPLGGTAPYKFYWTLTGAPGGSAIGTQQDTVGLEEGNYSVTIVDARGCQVTGTTLIIDPAPIVISVVGTTDATGCSNSIDGGTEGGSVSFNVPTGGFGNFDGYTIDISPRPFGTNQFRPVGRFGHSFTNLLPGVYNISVKDFKNCVVTKTITIFAPNGGITDLVMAQTPTSCAEGSDGKIKVEAVLGGFNPPFNYYFIDAQGLLTPNPNGVNNSLFVNLTAGEYNILVEKPGTGDIPPCRYTKSIVVTEPNIIRIAGVVTKPNCFNDVNASIDITASGGVGSYSYVWTNGDGIVIPSDAAGDVANLDASEYTVLVKDGNSCTMTMNFTIAQPESLYVSLEIDEDINDGLNGLDVNKKNVSCKGANDGYLAPIMPYVVINVPDNGSNNGVDSVTVGGTAPYTIRLERKLTGEANFSTLSTLNNVTRVRPNTVAFSGLVPATYRTVVIDSKGCTATSNVSVITEPAELVFGTQSITDAVTCNGMNGQIRIDIAGGNKPYRYDYTNTAGAQQMFICLDQLNDGDPNNDGPTTHCVTYGDYLQLNNVKGNTNSTTPTNDNPHYVVKVVDLRGCTISKEVIVNQPPTPALELVSVKNVSCNSGADGQATATATGYPDDLYYTYTWTRVGSNTPIGTGKTVFNLQAGDYYVYAVRQSTACYSDSVQFTVTEPAAFLPVVNVVNPTCFDDKNGSASIEPIGGTGPYTYQWSTGAVTQSISNLQPGPYFVVINDANGCGPVQLPFNIIDPPIISFNRDTLVSRDVSCKGGNDGRIRMTVLGGVPFDGGTYKIKWSKIGDTSFNLSLQDSITYIENLTAGTYVITAEDKVGCIEPLFIPVSEPAELKVSVTPFGCANQPTGGATAFPSGGTAPYKYQWSNGAMSQTVNNLAPGTYTVIITDKKGCNAAHTFTASTLFATASGVNSCTGENNGKISFNIVGGVAAYSVTWSGPENGAITYPANASNPFILPGLTPGAYTVSVKDAAGCEFNFASTVSVGENAQPLAVTILGTTGVKCRDGFDGTATLNVSGGQAPYAYTWTTGVTNFIPTYDSLPGGPNFVKVTDAVGCENLQTFVIEMPVTLLTLNAAVTPASLCNSTDGAIDLTATGGVPPYVYAWDNGATTPDISGLDGGKNYTVSVTDGNGCIKVKEILVGEPPAIEVAVDAATNLFPTCSGQGAIAITVTGGTAPFTYVWTKNGQSFEGNTTQDLSGLTEGVYIGTITDAKGCTYVSDPVSVNPPAILITAEVTNNKKATCGVNPGDGQISVQNVGGGGTPPYQYSLNGGDFQSENVFSGLGFGAYTVTIRESGSNQCTGNFSVVVDLDTDLTITEAQAMNPKCASSADGMISISVTGSAAPFTYQWRRGATELPSTTSMLSGISIAGTYYVEVADTQGCFRRDTFMITVPTALNVQLASYMDVTCNGGANGMIDINVSGGKAPYAYNWNNGQATTQDLMSLPAGDYNVIVTDANGCSAALSQVIGEPGAIAIATDITPTGCGGLGSGAIVLTPSGGAAPYTYEWSNGETTKDLQGLLAGTYSVTVTDANGCKQGASAEVKQQSPSLVPGFPIELTPLSGTACAGGSVTLTAPPAQGENWTYLWTNGDVNIGEATAAITVQQSYPKIWCTIITPCGQVNSDTVSVTINPAPPTPLLNLNESGDVLKVSFADPNQNYQPASYVWYQGANADTILANQTGDTLMIEPGVNSTYIVKVISTEGCESKSAPFTIVGREELVRNLPLQLYPNPTTGALIVRGEWTLGADVSVQVFNAVGQVVFTRDFKSLNANEPINFNIDTLPSGVYSVRVAADKRYWSGNVVKY